MRIHARDEALPPLGWGAGLERGETTSRGFEVLPAGAGPPEGVMRLDSFRERERGVAPLQRHAGGEEIALRERGQVEVHADGSRIDLEPR